MIMIRSATVEDAEDILNIYSYYVLNTHSTFELVAPSIKDFRDKIAFSNYPWLVIEQEQQIVGYAYATQWKLREAYRQTAEVSIYLEKDASGNGYGSLLYRELIDLLKRQNYHALLAGISLPNDSSIKLHEKLGFHKVGEFKDVGYKFDRWVDVGYWELVF